MKLYKKSELFFTILLIIVYIVGSSVAEGASDAIGMPGLITAIFHISYSLFLIFWCKKNRLLNQHGLCKPTAQPKDMLFYIPIIVLSTSSLWSGLTIRIGGIELVSFIVSMLCVGFLEELIFRGFLFKTMEKDGRTSAIIVSSLTFGIGHIINLFNGSGATLIPNLCQIACAIAFGFLFVFVFIKSRSILPCIISHSAINMLSAFEAETDNQTTIIVSAIIFLITAIAAFVYAKGENLKEKR